MNSSPALSPLTFLNCFFKKDKNLIEDAIYYSYARGALITAIQSIKNSKKMEKYPRVWVPSFICDTVFFLLDHYKIEYSPYPITEDLLPDWKSLENYIFSPNDVFVLVYFFGFPMGISDAKAFCEKKNILLVEDCAHSIVKNIKSNGIGTHGVAAIFGLRKIIPIPNGGFLYMKDMAIQTPPAISRAKGIYRHPVKMMLQWFTRKPGIRPPGINYYVDKSKLNSFQPNYHLFNFQESMSFFGKKVRNATDFDHVLEARKRNYRIYMEELRNLKLISIPKTLRDIDQEATPWVFFFFFKDAEWLINTLRKNGIFAGDFPNLHPSIFENPDYPRDNLMYRNSITLPVHQDLSVKTVKIIARKVKNLLIDYEKYQE
tara:strand:- start:7627 stop:8745 length:1119 start_codon:yes stop_codon:yes gene_type:complete